MEGGGGGGERGGGGRGRKGGGGGGVDGRRKRRKERRRRGRPRLSGKEIMANDDCAGGSLAVGKQVRIPETRCGCLGAAR